MEVSEDIKKMIGELRGFSLSLNPEVIRRVNACASCAIEGNLFATEMMNLWNSDKKEEFIRRTNSVFNTHSR